MERLSNISDELAVKLISEIDYDRHLQGTKIHAMSGGLPIIFTRLEEVKDFLIFGSLDKYLLVGSGTVNYLDWTKLKNWIRDVFDDEELAEAIGVEIDKGQSYVATMTPIRSLIEERLAQCYKKNVSLAK